jgi:hypothetical protein
MRDSEGGSRRVTSTVDYHCPRCTGSTTTIVLCMSENIERSGALCIVVDRRGGGEERDGRRKARRRRRPISRFVAHIDVCLIGTTHTDVHVKCADRRSRRHAHRQCKGQRGGEGGGRGGLL